MSRTQKILVYLLGVVIGVMILTWFPRPEREEHPWRERTAPDGYYPLEYTDAAGRTLNLRWQPRLLVSLAPSVTEILFAMEIGDQLIGATDWCNEPPAARKVERIGQMSEPNREVLMRLRPDLVIGSNLTPRRVYDQLDGLGLKSVMLPFDDYDDVLRGIRDIGRLTGLPASAARLHFALERRRQAILEQVGDRTGPRVALLYDLENLPSAGSGSWPDDFLRQLGTVNIAREAPSAWPRLSLEGVAAGDPEVIVLLADLRSQEQRTVAQERVARLRDRPVWRDMTAVREGRVHIVDASLFLIPGPRIIDALEALARAIYPDLAFEESDRD